MKSDTLNFDTSLSQLSLMMCKNMVNTIHSLVTECKKMVNIFHSLVTEFSMSSHTKKYGKMNAYMIY